MSSYDCIILAGGSAPWLQEICGAGYRIAAPLGGEGRRFADYILDALRASGCVRRIVLAAEAGALEILAGTLADDVELVRAEGDIATTARAAAAALGENSSQKILCVCDDIPLVTGEGVRDFLRQCGEYPEKEVFYPIIARAACLKAFPAARRTYATLADGVFTGGNMMLLGRRVIMMKQDLGREIFALRKSPLKLANWLGWSFVMKALSHRLSIAEAERRFEEIMRVPGKAVVTEYAGIGMDVDKPADYFLADKFLRESAGKNF